MKNPFSKFIASIKKVIETVKSCIRNLRDASNTYSSNIAQQTVNNSELAGALNRQHDIVLELLKCKEKQDKKLQQMHKTVAHLRKRLNVHVKKANDNAESTE